jgi:large subunit ribosomal protein L25
VSENVLNIELRDGKGKGAARKLRAAGRIPGIYYGASEDAQSVALDPRVLDRLISVSAAGINTLFDVKGGGALDGKRVLVKDIQRDPVTGAPLHADLYAVDLDKTIEVSVPYRLTGTAQGVKMGGIVDHSLREVELSCLPRSIPEEILVEISELDIGDSLHVRDIALPENVELISDPNLAVVSVVAPAAAEEEVVPEGEEIAAEEPTEGEEAEAAPSEPAAAEESPES